MKHLPIGHHPGYSRAKGWAEYRAWRFPGVRFTASVGTARLSYWVQDDQLHRRTWYVQKEDK